MTEMPRKRTTEDQSVIDLVARREGREWAERHAELILEQARAIGELPPAASASRKQSAGDGVASDGGYEYAEDVALPTIETAAHEEWKKRAELDGQSDPSGGDDGSTNR